jgi:hypothetical protein
MFGEKKPRPDTPEILPEDRVRLKPILGIRPGIYLALLYFLLLVGILFFLLLYPGIANPGSLISFSSEPQGAAVRVDGIYRGTTPCEIFVSRGRRSVDMVLPDFDSFHIERDIGASVFASAFFPRREHIRGVLKTGRPAAVLAQGAAEYAAWSFTGEPTGAYQVPLSLSEGAYRAGPAAADPAVRAEMEDLLRAAARFASTKAAVRDLLRAKSLIDNGGLPPSPLSMLRSAEDVLAYLSENPAAAAWIRTLLPQAEGRLLEESRWYQKAAAKGGQKDAPALTGNRMTFAAGGESPDQLVFWETRRGFWIAENEVSSAVWDAFTTERPEWGGDNAEALRARGLVTEDYLQSYDHPAYPYPAVPGVSWYAAAAFCQWLGEKLSRELRLPTEAEWEYAAGLPAGRIQNLEGGLWEWCADSFAPLPFPAPEAAVRAVGSPERSLRGGSWVNAPRSVNAETRASLPPESCSPFVSFRPVIVPPGAGVP